MHKIGDDITNLGGGMNYINCECITEINDPTEVTLTLDTVTGKYYLEGISTQTGTPTPDNPIEIVNTYKAGHYKTTINGTTYIFSLSDDLRSVGTVKDKFELDITNKTGSITRNIDTKIITGDESNFTYGLWQNNENQTAFYIVTSAVLSNNNYALCNYFENVLYSNIKNGTIGIGINGKNFGIGVQNNIATTVQLLKEWLSNIKLFVQYQSVTQTTENVEIDIEAKPQANLISTSASDWVNKTISVSNGAETNSSSRIIPINIVNVESSKNYYMQIPNTDYVFFNIHAYDNNGAWLGAREYFDLPSITGRNEVYFTTPDDVVGVKIVIRRTDNDALSNSEIENTGLSLYEE